MISVLDFLIGGGGSDLWHQFFQFSLFWHLKRKRKETWWVWMETDAASAQDVVVVVVCIRRKNRFLIFYDFSVPLWILIFFLCCFILTHCVCVLALVEGGWLKGCFWNRLKSRKISFGSPLFLLLRKQLRSCTMSTTRRLANTLIPQQQLDCNFCSRVCWRRRISPFYSSNKMNCNRFNFIRLKFLFFLTVPKFSMVFQFELLTGAYGILWPAIER